MHYLDDNHEKRLYEQSKRVLFREIETDTKNITEKEHSAKLNGKGSNRFILFD
jgi:hypothetical protein